MTYVELPTTDARRDASFYAAVLCWKIWLRADSDPRFEDEGAHLIGRWVMGRASTREPGIMSYFYVDHIADAVARVATNGGEVVDSPFREGDVWVARLRDPTGNTIGLWQFAEAT
jgi:predicted enzyme related to lactoylglutathione lyase